MIYKPKPKKITLDLFGNKVIREREREREVRKLKCSNVTRGENRCVVVVVVDVVKERLSWFCCVGFWKDDFVLV